MGKAKREVIALAVAVLASTYKGIKDYYVKNCYRTPNGKWEVLFGFECLGTSDIRVTV